MIIVSVNDNTELAIYKGVEVYAPKGEAISALLRQINL